MAGGEAEYSVGDRVYCTNNVVVHSRKGHTVAVRWGAAGTIDKVLTGKEANNAVVIFDRREDRADGDPIQPLMIPFNRLSRTQTKPLQGTWVQLAVDMHFRSAKVLQKGTPALILDMRDRGASLPASYVVRTAPMNIQAPMEFSVDPSEVEPFPQLPEGFPPCVGPLPEGLQFGDLVFCKKDIHIQAGEPPQPTCVVGLGDFGIVFAQAATEDGRAKGDVQVRFEVRRDNGRALWLSVNCKEYLSKDPPPASGRRVRLESAVTTSGGKLLEAGRVGTLVDVPVNGSGTTKLAVRLDNITSDEGPISFVAPENGLKVLKEVEMLTDAEKLNRFGQLECLAKYNMEVGKPMKTISLLEQNAWSLTNFGSGIGVSFTCASIFERTALVANSVRCLLLRERAAEGLDGTLAGESQTMFNHKALVGDASRVKPYLNAINAAAKGRKVLDIGTGPVCLLSRLSLLGGAATVDAVEVNAKSVEKALETVRIEASAGSAPSLPPWATLEVNDVRTHDATVGKVVTVDTKGNQQMDIYQGLSTNADLCLPGGYTMLVHEILGDQAGTESAAMVLDDIHKRGLCAKDCLFIPKRSSTLLAPTAALKRSDTEMLVHRWGHNGDNKLQACKRYAARNFHKDAILADPQPIEVLDFQNGPATHQERTLEFRTRREGAFDGMHLHMTADCDDENQIDTLALHTGDQPEVCSWNTTYVMLLEEPMQLSAGSRIVFKCVADLRTVLASYSVEVSVGEPGAEKRVSEFKWQGG
mmetsp:Transcript_51105/g.94571  ORF Transcript_51105/g.94571 Transcript_51105/m.94571 type:complete len:756 (-) Transcript_51105:83-2350(-)